MEKYLIGVDIGTQGTKAALFTLGMEMKGTAFEPSQLISPEPGVVWQDPEELVASCCLAIRSLLKESGVDGSQIAAIGLDGQMAGIMGVKEDGSAATYYDSWLDMRCGKYAEEMNKVAGRRVVELSGGQVTYVHGPKILWWKNEHPEIYEQIDKFVTPHAYVVGRMCGLTGEEMYFDYTHLHYSCLADNANLRWSRELLDLFGIAPSKMPRIVSPFEIVGTCRGALARQAGLPEGIPMAAGCGDTASSTFGSGMFERGMLLDIAGTASVMASVVDHFVPDGDFRTLTMMRSPVEGLFVPMAYINGGGMCVRWIRDRLGSSYDQLQLEAQKVPAGSEGLIFVPHFSGRVLPNDPDLKGAFVGLDFKHGGGHLYRAVLEGIAYEYAYYYRVLRTLYPEEPFAQMLCVGGGAKSDLFNQIKADVLGVKVSTYEMGETALIGAAVIAGMGAGVLTQYAQPICGAIRKGREYLPDPAQHAAYEKPAQNYLQAIRSVGEYFRAI